MCWWSLGPASWLILELSQHLCIVCHGTAVVPKSWAAGRRAGIWTSWNDLFIKQSCKIIAKEFWKQQHRQYISILRLWQETQTWTAMNTYTKVSLYKHWFHPYLDCPYAGQKLPAGNSPSLSEMPSPQDIPLIKVIKPIILSRSANCATEIIYQHTFPYAATATYILSKGKLWRKTFWSS